MQHYLTLQHSQNVGVQDTWTKGTDWSFDLLVGRCFTAWALVSLSPLNLHLGIVYQTYLLPLTWRSSFSCSVAGIPAPRCPPLLCLCRVQRACGASGCLAVTASPTLRFRSVVIENDWNKVEWSQVDASGKETTGYSSYRPTAGVWCFVKKVAVKVEARPTWQSCIIMWLFIIINPST